MSSFAARDEGRLTTSNRSWLRRGVMPGEADSMKLSYDDVVMVCAV